MEFIPIKIGNANGNETSDLINQNYDFVYDNRNLLIEFKNSSSPNVTFRTRYWYDEAGNRIRKLVEQGSGTGSTGGDEIDNWSTMLDEYYVRDISGKEIAIYQNGSLSQWNIWGLDNIGKIDANNNLFFYLKDHLGSVHAVVDANNNVVSAQDYDAWGYIMPERQWVQSTDQSIYKFTSKERDGESNYDYFGARYYDSRVARWGGVEPNYDKFIAISPYIYSLSNPVRLLDYDGNNPREGQHYNWFTTTEDIKLTANDIGQRISFGYDKLLSGDFSGALNQFIDNTKNSYEVLGLIPSNPLLDFVAPVEGFSEAQSLSKVLTLSEHASKRMIERGITENMIQGALEKGTIYSGHSSGALTYVLEDFFREGKSLVIGFEPTTKTVTTAFPTTKLISPKKKRLRFFITI